MAPQDTHAAHIPCASSEEGLTTVTCYQQAAQLAAVHRSDSALPDKAFKCFNCTGLAVVIQL